MARFQREISKLKKRLDKIEDELKKISIEIATTKETSNIYWAGMKKKVSKLYEQSRKVFADWSTSAIPDTYKKTLANQISRVKSMKFKPPIILNFNSFSKKAIHAQSIATILEDAVSSFFIGTDSGNKKFNKLINATQQLYITEKAVNETIESGFIKGAKGVFDPKKKVGRGSLYGAQRNLQNQLLKDSLDGKYITIIDKNGKPRNYNIKSYSEMVSRTKMIEAQSTATVNLSLGYNSGLVQVSSHNTQTPYDAQFEMKVFDLTGENPRFPNATDLPPFHPNCLHTLSVFFEEAHSEKEIEKISDFSKDVTDVHPTRKGHIPISKRELVA